MGCVRWLLELSEPLSSSRILTTPSSSLISLSIDIQTMAIIVGGVTGDLGSLATIGMDFFSRYLVTASILSSELRLISIQIDSPFSSCSPEDRCASWVASRLSICFRRCEGRTGGVRGLGGGAMCGVNVPSGLWR